MYKNNIPKIVFSIICIGLIVFTRLIDHAPNVTPVLAIAVLITYCYGWQWAMISSLVGMAITDAVLGWYHPMMMIAVYGSIVLAIAIMYFFKPRTPGGILGRTVLASVLFFVITNAMVWAVTPLYPAGISGLWQSYIAGLPFFRFMLMGDILYVIAGMQVIEVFLVLSATKSMWRRAVQLIDTV